MRSSRSRTTAAATAAASAADNTTTTTATYNSSNAIAYPPNCREINEDLSTDDLVRRLKDISMAFQQLSQDDDNSQYIPLAIELSRDFYLDHTSRDVKLLVACSIADVFRVYAPNAPYQDPALIRNIFRFFIQQLTGLQDPKHPTFKRYFYLLENLAWVKSFNICIELEDSQIIFCELFSLIFSIVNENHSEKVKNFMIDMLTPLILESDAASPELMEIIFTQLIEPKKSHAKHACQLAKEVIKKSIKTLGPSIANYLSAALSSEINGEESLGSTTNSHKGSSQPTAHYFKNNTVGLCDLIYELNKVVPETMQDFLPQLGQFVTSTDEKERCEYTKLLARLFSDEESNLAKSYPGLWKSFLGRFVDISSTVRKLCVQYTMHFLLNHPEMKADITEQMKQRSHDVDESVRYEVVMAIVSAAKKGMDNINEDLIEFVKDRAADSTFKIRKEALHGLAQLYRQYILNIKPDGPLPTTDDGLNAVKKLPWIKNRCMTVYFREELEDKLLVERLIHACLIPSSLPMEERIKVLYTFYATIDARAAHAFSDVLRQQQIVRRQVCDILEVMKEPSGAAKDSMLKRKVQICSRSFKEPVKAEEYIMKLIQRLENNRTLRDHLELIVSSANPSLAYDDEGNFIPPPSNATIQLSVREILRDTGFPVQTNSFYIIIKQLLERVAPILIDHEGILLLFSFVSDSLLGDGELDSKMGITNSAKRGLELILSFAHVFPALFHGKEPYNSYLLPFLWLEHSNHKVAELVLQILAAIGNRPFSKASKNDTLPSWAQPSDVIPRIIESCILTSSSPKQAKYAIKCLNSVITSEHEKEKIFGQILDSVKEAGLTLESSHFRTHLVALGMIATCGGQNKYSAVLKSIITKFVVKGLIMVDSRSDIEIKAQERSEASLSKDFDFEHSLDRCSEEVKCKIEGLKLIVRWVHGMKLNALTMPEQAELQTKYVTNACNTLKICKAIIENGGDLNEKGLSGTSNEKAHLRLAAASAMIRIVANDSIILDKPVKSNVDGESIESRSDNLKLRRAPAGVSTLITPSQIHVLATTLIDTQEFVHERFSAKLHKRLKSLELGLEFLAILCLGGYFSQDLPFYRVLQTYLHNNLTARRDLIKTNSSFMQLLHPDCTMPFVIHLLAHMPFYKRYDEVGQLEVVKECLWFIMEPMVFKNENYSFTFFKRTFESIKTCIDKETAPRDDGPLSPEAQLINYKIYCACDLALGLVMSKTQNFALKESPIRPQLHSKYYARSKLLCENNNKSYLPESMQFPPPKRCGLEAEMLSKTNKRMKRGG